MKSAIRNPQSIIPSLTSGLIIGMLDVALAISFAALIFAGPLAPFVPWGIGYSLAGFLITGIIIALFTSWPGSVGGSQSAPAAIMALMAAAIAGAMPAAATAEETFITVAAAIALTTLITGFFFLGTGYFDLGGLARFLPYPVVGGFLAGTGWLLITGAMSLMTDLSVALSELPVLMQLDTIAHWLPGVLIAIVTMIVLKYVDHYLVLPAMLLLSVLLFFAYAWLSGQTLADLSAGGWLLGPFAGEGLWQPLTARLSAPNAPVALSAVHWPSLLSQTASIASVVLISTVSLLLNAGGLELAVESDIDINKELRVAGVANTLAGLAAGLVGYQQISFSVLNHKLGANNRLPGLVAAAVCGLALLAGTSLLGLFPKVVVGALLFLLGLSLVVEWVVEGWSKLPRIDYAIVIAILLVTALVGFLEAVALGLLLAVILFVVGYSQVDVVRHELSAATYHSRVVRSREEEKLLLAYGEEIYVLQLQGFIFFGTADSLLKQVRRRMNDDQLPRLTAVVLDFEHVTGLDSTAMISFNTMKALVDKRQIALLLCAANSRVRKQLEQGGLGEEDAAVIYFDSADRGVAWGEQRLLTRLGMKERLVTREDAASTETVVRQMVQILEAENAPQTTKEDQDAAIKEMIGYCEKLDIEAGTLFISQGQPADSLYLLAAGSVTARLTMPDGSFIRLETTGGAGRIIGEVGFFLGGERTADVVADEPTILFRLTRDDLARMKQTNPQAASLLHRLVANILAKRVTRLTNSVNALER